MNIQHNISLKPYNTFGLDVTAKNFVSITSPVQLHDVLKDTSYPNPFILGGGSNMLLTKDVERLVMHINLKGIQVFPETNTTVLVTANAGENWHDFVQWTISKGYGGLENLSLIPGQVGTAPIQNIGAYGVELKDTFVSCNTIRIADQSLKTYTKAECEFGYRNSIFKQAEKGKHVIMSVTFRLTKTNHKLEYSYGAIANELKKNNQSPSIKTIANAVIRIRQSKLPDPKKIGNSGSFFKNPVITKTRYEALVKEFPNMPSYTVNDAHVKVPAGWLIEHAGFKGKTLGNYGVHKKQALVLVNYGGASGEDILKLARLIQQTIARIFEIDLEMEVNIF